MTALHLSSSTSFTVARRYGREKWIIPSWDNTRQAQCFAWELPQAASPIRPFLCFPRPPLFSRKSFHMHSKPTRRRNRVSQVSRRGNQMAILHQRFEFIQMTVAESQIKRPGGGRPLTTHSIYSIHKYFHPITDTRHSVKKFGHFSRIKIGRALFPRSSYLCTYVPRYDTLGGRRPGPSRQVPCDGGRGGHIVRRSHRGTASLCGGHASRRRLGRLGPPNTPRPGKSLLRRLWLCL